jgi:hypothetical protein
MSTDPVSEPISPPVVWTRDEPPAPYTHYVWDNDEDCPLGWIAVCRSCGNGPLSDDEEGLGTCGRCTLPFGAPAPPMKQWPDPPDDRDTT